VTIEKDNARSGFGLAVERDDARNRSGVTIERDNARNGSKLSHMSSEAGHKEVKSNKWLKRTKRPDR